VTPHGNADSTLVNAGVMRQPRGLFRKYLALMIGVVCAASLASGLIAIWFSYQSHKAALEQIQRQHAQAAADRIGQFVKEIEGYLGWTIHAPWSPVTIDERRGDARRLLRLAPAISELALVDASGKEQLRVSRMALDVVGSGIDRSNEPQFFEARRHQVFHGPAYLHLESEPYMIIALSGARSDGWVSIARVNLKFVWDVISQIKVGNHGGAYVVNAAGHLIAHPDISLVLRNTDLSALPQVQAARAGVRAPPQDAVARDTQGRQVLSAHAAIASLGWLVFVELPLTEAYAPLYASLLATVLVLLCALAAAIIASLLLVRTMVNPIRLLQAGAARIGAGALDYRIDIRTGDELAALGDQFNHMAAQLQEYYATLEHRVEERTHQLGLANLAKSRFIAAASHDLRQPLHALNLFVAQLRTEQDASERNRVVARIDAAVSAMNELFNALLDISRLDAGVLAPELASFPVARLLARMEATFAQAARERGLRLRIARSSAWIRSDVVLLERILLNLVSNAVRYTDHGGIVIGCRRREGVLRIEVWDSGVGIPADQHSAVFGEFHRFAGAGGNHRGGLGLGLAIVERLCRLLDHPLALRSRPGRGSCFSVTAPSAPQLTEVSAQAPAVATAIHDPASGKLILIIDDDEPVRGGMRGLLQSWGCQVMTAASADDAVAHFTPHGKRPDLIISDYWLTNGETGIQLIERLRRLFGAAVPAFLISGDTAPERLHEARASGHQLLHKPVAPMTLRAIVSGLLKDTGKSE
jgi:signal transduction histidine kinase/CheY-like chemotaxis protein